MNKIVSREPYQAPEVEVLEMQAEGVVCASNTYNGFGEEEIW
jgi:hypothetical protein